MFKKRGKKPLKAATGKLETAKRGFSLLSGKKNLAKTKDQRFVLEEKIGSGGLCDVYAALDLLRVECGDAVTRVAIKRLLPQYAENQAANRLLAREFSALRHISHQGVVRAFDLHRESWGLSISMELLEGNNLYEDISHKKQGLGSAGTPIAASLFETLSFLHSIGVAHGDIKPANIMCNSLGRAVLLDFGTAESAAVPGTASAAINQGLCHELQIQAFSAIHASPERLEGAAPSAQDDIFSACCTVYEIIEGAHPFKRLAANEAKAENLTPLMPDILKGKRWKLLQAGLDFDPNMRPDAPELLKIFADEQSSLLHRLFS